MRFLTTYSADIGVLLGHDRLTHGLVNLLALALSHGEIFLPDAAAYDDLFYKIVETSDILTKFRDAYNLSRATRLSSVDVLIKVSSHYDTLLKGNAEKAGGNSLSPEKVNTLIKQGYETLSIQAQTGLDQWEKFREADHKTTLKRVARVAVDDATVLLEGGIS